ncbi:lipid biosynthesis B12-binding/radical SAM protein [Geopsychrobacter electrodiphilus]|uniref:lipid biosynthesis B12-binding/radical SAM protein n=1 Tax=Geopsychrobacter electrodiphilus TaxID=225196 RepID=UPI0003756D32|nr:lipid biosynthesis B12-binding/radical SAM protein [Geopsychrobacter electrodiphilus]
MSRVFLISSNRATEPYPVYPLGMAVVAGALQSAGHQVRQYDLLVQGEEPLGAALEQFSPGVISISLRNIDDVDSFSGEGGWYLQQAKNLIETLRGFSAVPIVVGGPALTIMPEAIAEFLQVDHAIIGEGERSLPELVRQLAAGESAPLVIPRTSPLTGDQFSAPLFDQSLIDYYLRQSGMVNLQTKRGCPFCCSYCSYPHLEGDHFRVRDPRLVVDELEGLTRDHGVERVFFTDSIFNDPQGHYLQLVEELLRRDLKLRWSAFFRPQGLGRKELALMKRAGLYALELGTDAAADQTLAGINKGLRFDEVLAVNQACLDERLAAAHFVMFGGPDEDEQSLEEGLRNLQLLGVSVVFAFSGIRIFPDAPLHLRAVAEGLIAAETLLLKPAYYFSPRLDRQLMENRITASFAGRANRIFPPSEGLKRLQVMKKFGYRGLMWDQLVRFPKQRR